ncbi:ATP-binding protein [Parapusillimonas granuli]|nr:ATP-binding protein [Parapusillimonas granuli]MBB5213638.1 signal transduction histidine kinase [Parapusillimonas granuli]MEB2398730.1 ATP-binding protein [Alcaligenaceae bacterium]
MMQELSRDLQNVAPLGFIVLDKNHMLYFTNSYMVTQTGIPNENAIGRAPAAVYHGMDPAVLDATLRLCGRLAGKPVIADDAHTRLEIHVRAAGEAPRILHGLLYFSFVDTDDGHPYYALFFCEFQPRNGSPFHQGFSRALQELRQTRIDQQRLLAELERANDQLLRSDKLASIGQLAAGVAHEINNPVGYVFSNLKTLASYVRDLIKIVDTVEDLDNLEEIRRLKQNLDYQYIRNDVEALIQESEEGIGRIKRIISSLQDFSHIETNGFSAVDLHQGIESTLSIAGNEIRQKAVIVKEYGQLPPVECDISQIKQVVLNLVINAAQSIDGTGVITIRTGTQGSEAWLEVEDTGQGIDEAFSQRIFEPFFTTKPVGQGTGLGLALSNSIVQKHQGRIEVSSRLGEGSRFRVWLPIKQPTAKEPSDAV